MSINGITLKAGATGHTIVAGTDRIYVNDGLRVLKGIHVVDSSATNLLLATHATLKNTPFTQRADKTYTKGLREGNFTLPKTLASGLVDYQTFDWRFGLHPEITAAELLEIRMLAAQWILDAELDLFYRNGSTL